MCGADGIELDGTQTMRGSPPRVRSRLTGHTEQRGGEGITSACAEQTRICRGTTTSRRDHLRVCGADRLMGAAVKAISGSPPRVRSRLHSIQMTSLRWGITSACAEQTAILKASNCWARDHLRVCGADQPRTASCLMPPGSPPRVRSRRQRRDERGDRTGITSACAEQTVRGSAVMMVGRDHLRVCGADDK